MQRDDNDKDNAVSPMQETKKQNFRIVRARRAPHEIFTIDQTWPRSSDNYCFRVHDQFEVNILRPNDQRSSHFRSLIIHNSTKATTTDLQKEGSTAGVFCANSVGKY